MEKQIVHKAIHLPGLNGLRAIAALSVVIAPSTQEGISDFGLPWLFNIPLAGYSVTLFFVISGFLITYLLVNEFDRTDTVNVGKFYVRRILRIWPIYYLFMIIAVTVICVLYGTDKVIVNELWYYVFFAANLPFITHSGIVILVHYWSIGVEEQFYLFWPWLTRFFYAKLLKLAIALFILFLGLKVFIWTLWGASSFGYRFFMVTRFHCMMVGAIAAILYIDKNNIFLRFAIHKLSQTLAWILFVIMGLGWLKLPTVVGQELISIASVSMILGQVMSKNKLINLETKIFDFVGKISYGIYVIHPIVIVLLSIVIKPLTINIFLKYFLTYFSVITTTILLAWLSFQYFEKPFLRIKRRFMVVESLNSMVHN